MRGPGAWLGPRRLAAIASKAVPLLGPRVAARLTARSFRHYPAKGGPTLLVLSRPTFDKDIVELRARTGLGFVVIEAGFTRFQEGLLARPRREQTEYQAAARGIDPRTDPQVAYARELLRLARRLAPVDGVLSANFDYWQDFGFKVLCREEDLVFGVLCRENAVIPFAIDFVRERYTRIPYRFEGDFIATASASPQRLFRELGIAPPEHIHDTGLPRYDAWSDRIAAARGGPRPYVTLLTFTHGYRADATFREVAGIFVEAARACADTGVTFLIKTKERVDTEALARMVGDALPPNVVIDATIDMATALEGSRAIVGYNSLALIDALLSGSSIVLPAWGECATEGPLCMYPRTPESEALLDYADGPGALSALLEAAARGRGEAGAPVDAATLDYVRRYVTYDPGVSISERFAALVGRYVDARRGG